MGEKEGRERKESDFLWSPRLTLSLSSAVLIRLLKRSFTHCLGTTDIFLQFGQIFTLRPTRPHFLTSRERKKAREKSKLCLPPTPRQMRTARRRRKKRRFLKLERGGVWGIPVRFLACTPFLRGTGFLWSVARYVCVGSFCDDDNKRRKGWEIVSECDRTEPKSSPTIWFADGV